MSLHVRLSVGHGIKERDEDSRPPNPTVDHVPSLFEFPMTRSVRRVGRSVGWSLGWLVGRSVDLS